VSMSAKAEGSVGFSAAPELEGRTGWRTSPQDASSPAPRGFERSTEAVNLRLPNGPE
jgi:hypothetical protein